MGFKLVEPSSLCKRYLAPNFNDKRRQRRYHRKAAEWWLNHLPFTKSCERLAKLHMRDARNG